MANKTLTKAKAAKNDEFYTQFYDIETEMEAYLDYNRDVFRGKTVLLPCDDPEWSNFTRYFAQNFEALGLRNLSQRVLHLKARHISVAISCRFLKLSLRSLIKTKPKPTVRYSFLPKILQATE